jgi:hypothetical protein
MDIKKQEALDVLRGWRTEGCVVQCGVNVGVDRVSQILGKVDTVEASKRLLFTPAQRKSRRF